MKTIPKWALIAGLGGVAWLLFRNSAALRQDVYKAGKKVSQATGGRLPNVAAGVLPNVTPDPGFGVSYPIPDWLLPSSLPPAAPYTPPAFGVGLN